VAFLIDDGLATGFTMRAALGALRDYGAQQLIVAVPVGSDNACRQIAREVDALICPFLPNPFHAVGLWYKHFEATTDKEVQDYLVAARLNRESVHAERRDGHH
jgi:predicted phosphoribosyltransferase